MFVHVNDLPRFCPWENIWQQQSPHTNWMNFVHEWDWPELSVKWMKQSINKTIYWGIKFKTNAILYHPWMTLCSWIEMDNTNSSGHINDWVSQNFDHTNGNSQTLNTYGGNWNAKVNNTTWIHHIDEIWERNRQYPWSWQNGWWKGYDMWNSITLMELNKWYKIMTGTKFYS